MINQSSDSGTGHLLPPTLEQIANYATGQGLQVPPRHLDQEAARVAAFIRLFDRFSELEDTWVPRPVRHGRDQGWIPNRDEDPYNAIIRFCEVRGAERGPLANMRIGVKDTVPVAGVPMTQGIRDACPPIPIEDAVVVERLLDAGASITAKTNVALFGKAPFGWTRNPCNPRFSAGASSSGSAAAVAAGIVDAALGVDEGGSIRGPAASCGIVGMKATHGLVPSHGLPHQCHGLEHIGPMTKSVYDSATMLEVMAGSDWRDPLSMRAGCPKIGNYTNTEQLGIHGLRIGVVADALEPIGCTLATLAAFDDAQELLSKLGAELVIVSVPLWNDAPTIWLAAYTFGLTAMTDRPGAGHLSEFDTDELARQLAKSPVAEQNLPFGRHTLPLTFEHLRREYRCVPFARAHNLRLALRHQLDSVLSDVDVLITPTLPTGPQELGIENQKVEKVSNDRFGYGTGLATCSPANLTGHPALTVPSAVGDNGLPTGLQIIGRHFDERTIYQAAFAFEASSSLTGL